MRFPSSPFSLPFCLPRGMAVFRPAALSIFLSALAADYYFVSPVHSFQFSNSVDQISLLVFIVVGLGMALLSHPQRRALERAACV